MLSAGFALAPLSFKGHNFMTNPLKNMRIVRRLKVEKLTGLLDYCNEIY